LPASAEPNLQPASDGQPVEVELVLNGVAYHMLIEGLSRDRSFGRADLSASGRGLAAQLDAPYAAVTNYGNPTADRTAAQLANDVLTFNGASIGWTVDWKPEDWTVPAGVFAHQGTYITALNAIAGAAGAYVQPQPTGQALSVLLRYPAAPWEWSTLTPDYELPADLFQKESVEWVERTRYNRVFVSGQGAGVLGQVTRGGTAGDQVAPMVVDPLTTDAIAARQRGMSVLANVGRQALISLVGPVLPATGIIMPGKFVRYVDGGVTRIGLTRSVSVSASMPTMWQTIGLETHVSP
jgi:hypothetical protein